MSSTPVAVLINIIEARDLKPRASAGMADPVCLVEVLGHKEHTPVIKKDLSPYWDHFFHLEGKSNDFEHETMRISVFDSATYFRKELIGSFEFDLVDIHRQPNHEYYNTWVILANHNISGKPGVQGYLKVSVEVLKPGDQPAKHEENEGGEDNDNVEDDLSAMVLLKPKGLDGIESVLRARIYKAENLPKMDIIGSCDPFVQIKFGTNTGETSTIQKNLNPQWNEEVQIPVTLPTLADIITVKLFDQDQGKPSELISVNYVSFKEVQAKAGGARPFWVNFYTGEGQGKEGTDFAGRVLNKFTVDSAQAKVGRVPIAPEGDPECVNYTLGFDLFELQGIQAMYGVYARVQIGNYTVKSKSIKTSKHGGIEYYEAIPDLDVSFPSDLTQVPDIFVYVYEDVPGDDKRIGYLRFTPDKAGKLNVPKWHMLKRKFSKSKDDETPPGFIQFRLNFGPSSQRTARPAVTKPPKKPFQFRAHLFLGRNLPAGDEDALSDPYCVVSVGPVRAKTKVKEHTVFADWYETVSLDLELPDQADLYPDVHLLVYDYDKLSADEFLGRVTLPLSEASTSHQVPPPRAFPLCLREQTPYKGEVLASFQLLPSGSASSVPVPNLKPKFIDTEIEIGIIGLRELAPFQLLPTQNAYVRCTVSGSPKSTASTKKSNKPKGDHPNYFENLLIPASLPDNVELSPALQIEVFDTRPFKDALIAVASVPLSSFIPWGPSSAAQQGAASFGANIPPPVDENVFYQPPPVLPSTSSSPPPPVSVVIEVEDHPIRVDTESTGLLSKDKYKVGVDADVTLANISPRPEVQVTVIPGMEEEPEPPPREEIPSEMEHQLKSFPFIEIDLFRGTSAGISSGNLLTKRDSHVGRFKGSIHVRSPGGSSSNKGLKMDVTKINVPRPFVLRVYVETGANMVPHDDNGSSDPYLSILCGKTKIKDVEGVQKHTLQPNFYKMYTVRGVLPDENEAKVQVWDKDEIGSDDLIGETKYDLEMLWFSEEWRKTLVKPKESRTLWSPLSVFPQGKLKMWIELLTPEEAVNIPPTPIAPPEKQPFELRIIVWETKNVVPKDKILGKDSSDQLVVTKLLNHPQAVQQTDVHNSVMDGCGKFNYRILYANVFLPYDVPRLKVQVYDKDAIGPNDAIAEANLNLKGFFQKAYRLKSATIGNSAPAISVPQGVPAVPGAPAPPPPAGPYNTGQWLDVFHPSFEGPQGTICMELELLTVEDALKKRAGPGRSDPNQNPFLPEPVRPARNWLGDFASFFGLDKIKKYLIIAAVVIVVVLVIVIVLQFV